MTKKVPKRASSPVKTEVFPKTKVFFYSKRPPSLAKNRNFAWKNDKKLTKKGTKKTTHPRKNWSFAWKKCIFFTQKDHPAPQKAEVLHEKMTKNWQKVDQKNEKPPVKPEVLHEKLKTVLPMGILKKKSRPPTSPNF